VTRTSGHVQPRIPEPSRHQAQELMIDEKLKVLVHSSAATRSHMVATLAISEELVKRGHSVTFAAMDGFLKFAANYNLTLVSLGKSTESERGIKKRFRLYSPSG
ncbi:hypothetical protein L0F63_002811, partial [Massospora cicadina]